MKPNIKKTLIIPAAVLLVVAIAVGIIFALKASNVGNNSNTVITNESADALKSQAVEALATDKEKAKDLFEEAKAQYEKLEDQDGIVDMEAQIYLLDHPVESK